MMIEQLSRQFAFADPADVAQQIATMSAYGLGREAVEVFADYEQIARQHNLTDVGRIGAIDSRNHARKVIMASGSAAVVKISVAEIGDEVGALLAWQRAGLAGSRTPRVHASGQTAHGYSWTLQQHISGARHPIHAGRDLLPDAFALARRISVPASYLHEHARRPQLTVADLLDLRLNRIVEDPAAPASLSAVAGHIHAALDRAEGRPYLVHGDFAANNIVGSGNRLATFDPAGLVGPSYADAARFLARSTSTLPVAPRVAAAAEIAGAQLAGFSTLVAAELVDVAHWSLTVDITGRGWQALTGDAIDTLTVGAGPRALTVDNLSGQLRRRWPSSAGQHSPSPGRFTIRM